MAKVKLSQTMEEALSYLGRSAYRAHMEPERRTLEALERRGMIQWNMEAFTSRVHDSTRLWEITLYGWAWLKENLDQDRPADAGRLTVEEALADTVVDVEQGGDIVHMYSAEEFDARIKSAARYGNGLLVHPEHDPSGITAAMVKAGLAKSDGCPTEEYASYRLTALGLERAGLPVSAAVAALGEDTDATRYTGTVRTAGRTSVVADFPEYPVQERVRVAVPEGHGLEIGSRVLIDSRGFWVVPMDEAAAEDVEPFESPAVFLAAPNVSEAGFRAVRSALNKPYGRIPGTVKTATVEALARRGWAELAPVHLVHDSDASSEGFRRGYDWVLTRQAFGSCGRSPVADPGRLTKEEALAEAYAEDFAADSAAMRYVAIVRTCGQDSVGVELEATDAPSGPRAVVLVPKGHHLQPEDRILVNGSLELVDGLEADVPLPRRVPGATNPPNMAADPEAPRRDGWLPEVPAEAYGPDSVPLDEPVTGTAADQLRDDLYVDRAAWRASSAGFHRLGQMMGEQVRQRNVRLEALVTGFRMAFQPGGDDPREADTVRGDDTLPMVYQGVRVPDDIAENWHGVAAISWSRGVQAAAVAVLNANRKTEN